MKKFVFTLLLVFVCHLGYAQGINGLFNEFGSEKNADCVKVSSFMMSLGKMFAGHDEDAEIIRKIKFFTFNSNKINFCSYIIFY